MPPRTRASKDRARPFSRKHRRYWIPITGGMILIGVINVAIGYCTYTPQGDPPERIVPTLPGAEATRPRALDEIGLADIPAPVMRTFATTYPRNVPTGARKIVAGDGAITYEVMWSAGASERRATFRADGTLETP